MCTHSLARVLGLSQTFLQPVMLMFEVPHRHIPLNGEGEPHAQGDRARVRSRGRDLGPTDKPGRWGKDSKCFCVAKHFKSSGSDQFPSKPQVLTSLLPFLPSLYLHHQHLQ